MLEKNRGMRDSDRQRHSKKGARDLRSCSLKQRMTAKVRDSIETEEVEEVAESILRVKVMEITWLRIKCKTAMKFYVQGHYLLRIS